MANGQGETAGASHNQNAYGNKYIAIFLDFICALGYYCIKQLFLSSL
jgi:hypothetical protein